MAWRNSFFLRVVAPFPFPLVRRGRSEHCNAAYSISIAVQASRSLKRSRLGVVGGEPKYPAPSRRIRKQSPRRSAGGRGTENRCKVDINNHDLGGWERHIQDVARELGQLRLRAIFDKLAEFREPYERNMHMRSIFNIWLPPRCFDKGYECLMWLGRSCRQR